MVVRKFPSLGEQVDDIVQEVHFRLLRNLTQAKFSRKSSFEHYVRTVSLYVCIDVVRRRKPTTPFEGSDSHIEISSEVESALERLVRREDIDHMLLCLGQLSKLCRDILRLRFCEEKSHGEIADLMGGAVSTSRVRLKRCLNKLIDLFRKRKKGKQ
jgi:RNA polymerase sigma factor (sigma-70 family)